MTTTPDTTTADAARPSTLPRPVVILRDTFTADGVHLSTERRPFGGTYAEAWRYVGMRARFAVEDGATMAGPVVFTYPDGAVIRYRVERAAWVDYFTERPSLTASDVFAHGTRATR